MNTNVATRGPYLKAREMKIAVRRLNRKSTLGYDIIHNSLDAIMTIRATTSQYTKFETGTNVSEEQYAVNVTPAVRDVIGGDDVILYLTEFTDESIANANENIIKVKNTMPGVKITRLNCVELGG